MRTFRCDCGQLLFFENTVCVSCGKTLGFSPNAMELKALSPGDKGEWLIGGERFRLCRNYAQNNVCNWIIPVSEPQELCSACRLNEIIPDLTVPGNPERWALLEQAKRRLLYTLLQLRLPVESKVAAPSTGMAFRFLADSRIDATKPVQILTGHDEGIITINVAEADDVEREKARKEMGETFRTLLGHFRHESGHYFWERLVARGPHFGQWRQLFGDETACYEDCLGAYYAAGPNPDWCGRFISAYASSHPWEDWAETWAHYLHMRDALETARDFGLTGKRYAPSQPPCTDEFDRMINEWVELTVAINSLNRSLGHADAYPFVLPSPVIEKLRFVHTLVGAK